MVLHLSWKVDSHSFGKHVSAFSGTQMFVIILKQFNCVSVVLHPFPRYQF